MLFVLFTLKGLIFCNNYLNYSIINKNLGVRKRVKICWSKKQQRSDQWPSLSLFLGFKLLMNFSKPLPTLAVSLSLYMSWVFEKLYDWFWSTSSSLLPVIQGKYYWLSLECQSVIKISHKILFCMFSVLIIMWCVDFFSGLIYLVFCMCLVPL